MSHYKHLFFDLDNTLWDYKANAREAFEEIFSTLSLNSVIPDFERFLSTYEKFNENMWIEYRKGMIKKEILLSKRFLHTFRELGINNPKLADKVGELYVNLVPTRSNIFPGVRETLAYLQKRYNMYVLSNGFEMTQMRKIVNSGLQQYFKKLFTADMAGYAKPDPRFFEYAVKSIHAHKKDCLMIGDDPEADIRGAKSAGIDQVLFNPGDKTIESQSTYNIRVINELMIILQVK